MTRTCANDCKFARPESGITGHFLCDHPTSVATRDGLSRGWGAAKLPPDTPDNLPACQPGIRDGTLGYGHPTDCTAWVGKHTSPESETSDD